MSNEPKMSPTEVFIDGKSYTLGRLRSYIKFYDDHQIERGQKRCPLCESYYDENDLFVCDECGNLFSTEEQCIRHEHNGMKICIDCCLECRRQKAFEDAVDQKIDIKRGK